MTLKQILLQEIEEMQEKEQLILLDYIKSQKKQKKIRDVLGLFEDEPELADQICNLAMESREKNPLRIFHE